MTGAFLTKLELMELDGGSRFALDAPLVYRAADGTEYTVPTGTTTDFASVPRVFQNILPPYGKHSKAAVLHDWLYQTAPNGMTKATADGLFKEAMQASGVGWVTRQTMWLGVKAGGAHAWNGYRNAQPGAVSGTE